MSVYRGILVADPRLTYGNIDAANTTADEQGIETPPTGAAASSTNMVLKPSGSISDGDVIQVDTRRGGYAGADYRAGGFSYTADAGTTDFYWDAPNAHHGWEWLNFRGDGPPVTDAKDQFEPHLCVLPDGDVLLACKEGQGGSAIRVRRFSVDDSTWDSGTTLTSDSVLGSSDSDMRYQPCIVALPSGRLHLYHFVDLGSDLRQIAYWTSDDEGASWTLASPAILNSTFDTGSSDPDILRVAISETGEMAMAIRASGSLLWYAATAPGARFQSISVNDGSLFDDPAGVRILPEPSGGFRVFVHSTSDSDKIRYRVFGSAFDADEDSTSWGTITTVDQITVLPSFDVWRDEDGTLYLNVVGLGTTTPRHFVYRSENGYDWESTSGLTSQGYWLATASEAYTGDPTYVSDMSSVTSRGLTITAGHLHTRTYTIDSGSIIAVYSGGYTTTTMPPSQPADLDVGRQAWLQTYWGVDDPTEWGEWTGTGTATETLTIDGWEISTTSGQTRSYASGDASLDVEDQEIIVEIRGSGVTSNISSDPRSGLTISYYNGSDEYIFGVNFTSIGFATTDRQTGSYSSTYSLDMDNEWELRIALYRNRFAVWYRAGADDGGGRVERAWTLATSGDGLATKSGGGSGITITWGNLDTGAGTDSWTCREVSYALQPADYLTDTGAEDLPLNPRSFSRTPIPLGSGLKLSAVSGPTEVGDSWTVEPVYRYGLANLDDPSPAVEWRSSSDSSSIDIVWDLHGFADDAPFLSEALGVALIGANFRQFSIVGIPHGGIGIAEDTLLTVYASPYDSLSGTLAFDYKREGSILSCQASTTKAETSWIGHGDLVGAYVVDTTSGATCPILANTSGKWTDDSTIKPLRLHLGGDPSALPATGVCQIVVPNVAAFHLAANLLADYRYVKLSIPAQDTPDGYFRLGRLMLGPLHLFGVDPSWARTRNLDTNVELTTRRDGSRSAYKRGDVRRALAVKWSEGIDESEVYSDSMRSEVYSGGVLTVPGDTAQLTEGIFRELEGALTPCVYFASVDDTVGTGTLTSPRAWMYGRITSQWTSDVILGEEESSQLVRVGEIRIEEEV